MLRSVNEPPVEEMTELERTDQEIDDAIDDAYRKGWSWKQIRDSLKVSNGRIANHWDRFREEVYTRIVEGRSDAEIAQELRLPRRRVGAFRAGYTRRMKKETGDNPPDEIHDAVDTTLRLEKDLQTALLKNIVGLEAGLEIIDTELSCAAGKIDILCKDGKGALVVIELKAGEAKVAAVGQILGYMGAINREMTADGKKFAGQPVRGIIVAKNFQSPVLHAVVAVPNLRLVSYAVQFTFKRQGPAGGGSA